MNFEEGMGFKKLDGKFLVNGKEMKPGITHIEEPRFGKSASFERLDEKAHDKEVEERLKQDPKTYTDEEVRQRRILGQTGNLFIDDDPEEGGWK